MNTSESPTATDYGLLLKQAVALVSSERNPIVNAANLAALLFSQLDDINWAGFYFTVGGQQDRELLLGPFQGLPACIRLPWGEGVCGKAAATRTIQRVADVHAFDGHIACDAASRSELVVPLIPTETSAQSAVIGVLDLDSPLTHRFTGEDEEGLARIAKAYLAASDMNLINAIYR